MQTHCFRRFLVAMVPLFLLFLVPSSAKAQYVIGVSAILGTTDSTHIDTYSATEMDYLTSFSYEAYVEGYLFQNNGLIADGYAFGNPTAGGSLTEPLTVGDTYEIDSYHYLYAEFQIYDPDSGFSTYDDPYGYLDGGGGDSGYPSGNNFIPGGDGSWIQISEIFLGYTYVVLPTGVPSVSSISPGGASVGSNGTITLQGENLEDPFTQSTTPSITGSGIDISVESVSPTTVTLSYNIAQNAGTGTQNITLATRFGTSNAAGFNIGDPTPIVTGISPDIWPAGSTNLTVTITGRGFGTNPSVSVSSGYVTVGTVNNASDTSLQVNVSVSSNAPDQSVTVQVQSNGYYGSGFVATNQGQSSTGSNAAQLQAIPAPAPFFVMGTDSNGSLCTSGTPIQGTQTVVPGQQIGITACIPQSGLSVLAEVWQMPGNMSSIAVGGFTVGTQSQSFPETLTQWTPTNCSAQSYCDLTPFYWLANAGQTQTLVFVYNAANGKSASALLNFSIQQITGNLLLQPNMKTDGTGVRVLLDNDIPKLSTTGIAVGQQEVGITFAANATPPSSGAGANQSFTWVQVLTSVQRQYLISKGVNTVPTSPASGLDITYPYTSASTSTTNDTPAANLLGSGEGDGSRSARRCISCGIRHCPVGAAPRRQFRTATPLLPLKVIAHRFPYH